MPGNILFIMCDQLRWDYLSCYGHPTLQTPNIDRLAARGLRFDRAYCQAPLCGPSRASFLTGRYPSSHGVMANEDFTRLDEMTLADYLRPLGYRSVLVGKADNRKDGALIGELGIAADSPWARAARSGGFEPFAVHEGLLPGARRNDYTDYLARRGYRGDNPWRDHVVTSVDPGGGLHDGWLLRNSAHPARVDEADSETAWTTDRALAFLEQHDGAEPWCLHLSYIKPHWPLVAPAPYHAMFAAADVQPALRDERELRDPHPVYRAFAAQEYSRNYSRDDVRARVVPVYMGLVRQIDDQLGRLFDHMTARGLLERTMIVFCSDHGDYLGDHWLGEKDLMHEPSARIPLLVVDPRRCADATRGRAREEPVEAIDLLPTLVEFAGGLPCRERLEGRSLAPLLHSPAPPDDWRDHAVSEIDYSDRGPRRLLGQAPYDCRAVMLRGERWKYVHYEGFRPQLFDLRDDPRELVDRGADPGCKAVRDDLRERLYAWRSRLKPRVGTPYADLDAMGPERDEANGIIIGRW